MVMNKTARPSFLTWTRALALLTVLGLAWLSTPEASAQLGSLVVTADVTIIGAITVRGVQFKLDGANLGAEDTSGPYSIPWDTRTASNASHTLTAVARDLLGLEWTSDPVTVTVFNDKTPPTVSITSPSSGAAVRATISLNAAASDNIGVVGVQFVAYAGELVGMSPRDALQRAHEVLDYVGLGEAREGTAEDKLARGEGALERSQVLAAEDPGERLDWEEKAGRGRVDAGPAQLRVE